MWEIIGFLAGVVFDFFVDVLTYGSGDRRAARKARRRERRAAKT